MQAPSPVDAVPLLLERVASLGPVVDEHREAMDRERRLPAPLVRALARGGLFRLWLPRAFGGWELPLPAFMQVVEAAAALDGSVGWIVGNVGGMGRAAGHLPVEAARAVFEDPDAFVVATNGSIGEAVPIDGGFRVTGRWPYASGIHSATFVAAACRVVAGPRNGEVILCYVPAVHARIIDNWHVAGLRGSGSCDYVLEDAEVPLALTHDMLQPPATQPGPLYRLPAISLFATTVSVVPLGIARAALDAFCDDLAYRTRVGTSSPLRERESIQSEVGRAQAMLEAGRALLLASMGELERAVATGGNALVAARARYRSACTFAAQSALGIAGILAAAAGASSIRESDPLERRIRDIQAASCHIAMSPNNYIVSGRVRLGLDPGTPRF